MDTKTKVAVGGAVAAGVAAIGGTIYWLSTQKVVPIPTPLVPVEAEPYIGMSLGEIAAYTPGAAEISAVDVGGVRHTTYWDTIEGWIGAVNYIVQPTDTLMISGVF